MIYGIGTDICDIARIEKVYGRFQKRFIHKILTATEKENLPHTNPAPWLAKRFAAKEAIVKAMGTGFRGGVSFQDIEVLNNKKGAPKVHLSAHAQKFVPSKSHVFVSLSDEKGYALAFAVVEQVCNGKIKNKI